MFMQRLREAAVVVLRVGAETFAEIAVSGPASCPANPQSPQCREFAGDPEERLSLLSQRGRRS